MSRQLNHPGNIWHGEAMLFQKNASMYAPSYKIPVKFNPLMGILFAMLFMSFFVLGWLAVYLKKCIRRELRRHHVPSAPVLSSNPLESASIVQPARGLDMDTILALPTAKFTINPPGEDKLSHECPVCLSEFQDDEFVKILPVCGHAFHVPCIDKWLVSNSTCPICRSSLALLEPCCKTCSLYLEALQHQSLFPGVVSIGISQTGGTPIPEDNRMTEAGSSTSSSNGSPTTLRRSLSTPTGLVSEGSCTHRSDTCKEHDEAKSSSLSRAFSCDVYEKPLPKASNDVMESVESRYTGVSL